MREAPDSIMYHGRDDERREENIRKILETLDKYIKEAEQELEKIRKEAEDIEAISTEKIEHALEEANEVTQALDTAMITALEEVDSLDEISGLNSELVEMRGELDRLENEQIRLERERLRRLKDSWG